MERLVTASEAAALPAHRLHRDPDFDSLRGYRPFDALVTPK